MHIRIRLRKGELEALLTRLHQAYARGELRLIKRIQALLYVIDGKTVAETAAWLKLSDQAIYNYLSAFLLNRLESLVYQRPPGRPRKLTKTQRRILVKLIDRGPEAAGYDCGCWDTVLIQDLIYTRFGVEYNPHYVAELLKNIGCSYQKGRFVSDHLDDVAAAQKEWLEKTWPEMVQLAHKKGALILFGDEASFAQWGSLSYTWGLKGKQPTVKTSGLRKAYKIFGLIDYLSGKFFYKGHTGKFNSDSYQTFLTEVLAQTTQHIILIQDGARYHTSKAMVEFFAQHQERLTVQQLPAYSPDFNPIEYLWRNIKKQATHMRYFPTFADLTRKVDDKLRYFAHTPKRILNLMGKYCRSLGAERA